MESCRVITPCGSFTATWPDDEEARVRYSGSLDGIEYFKNFMQMSPVIGEGGRRLAFETLEPGDLRGFCQSEEYGITVEQDVFEVDGDE